MSNASNLLALAPRRCLPPLWREVVPIVSTVRRIALAGKQAPSPGGGHPIMVIPGLFVGDSSLAPMTRHLETVGYDVWESTITCNVGCSESTAERLGARLEHIARHVGSTVAIVGHSRGGLLGRVIARRHPELVSGLVTLGSPCQDQLAVHPLLWLQLGSMAALGSLGLLQGVLRVACGASRCCERFREDLAAPLPAELPHMSVYSRRDGVVDWRACRDPRALELEVTAAHCEMPCDAVVQNAVSGAIRWFQSSARRRHAAAGPLSADGGRDGLTVAA
jgi:pimeloyl-ACP methyl ester carboxylesterase